MLEAVNEDAAAVEVDTMEAVLPDDLEVKDVNEKDGWLVELEELDGVTVPGPDPVLRELDETGGVKGVAGDALLMPEAVDLVKPLDDAAVILEDEPEVPELSLLDNETDASGPWTMDDEDDTADVLVPRLDAALVVPLTDDVEA